MAGKTRSTIVAVEDGSAAAAVDLLHAFFEESGFPGDRASITAHLQAMLADPHHWAALAQQALRAIGIVTVTTMLYVEWGRLGEIGDLYVVPTARRQGVARELIEAALSWCREHGCSAVSVTVTEHGENEAGLGRFYKAFGFKPSGRQIHTLRLE